MRACVRPKDTSPNWWKHAKAALVRHGLGDLQQWQTQLRALANRRDHLARAVRARPAFTTWDDEAVIGFAGDRASQPPPHSLAALFPGPPGWIFHVLTALPAGALLHSVSLPGVDFVTAMLAYYALVLAAGLWAVRGITYLVARRRGWPTGDRRWWWFAVAPVGGVVVALLIGGSVPLQARWALSESAFEEIVRDVTPTASVEDRVDLPAPGRIGLYRITDSYRQGDAVVFHEATGAPLGFAGFAYLPSGPFPELMYGSVEQGPWFRHLSGDWYAWTAHW